MHILYGVVGEGMGHATRSVGFAMDGMEVDLEATVLENLERAPEGLLRNLLAYTKVVQSGPSPPRRSSATSSPGPTCTPATTSCPWSAWTTCRCSTAAGTRRRWWPMSPSSSPSWP